MRKFLSFLAIIAVLEGVTGVLNQVLAGEPSIPLRLFDHFNRLVVERSAFLNGYEVWANAALAILGVVLAVAVRLPRKTRA
ncbi:hypothetical protein [Nonomuraea sp. NPDC002799]